MENTTSLRMIEEIFTNGSARDKQVVRDTIEAIYKTYKQSNMSYISNLLHMKGTMIDENTFEIIIPNSPLLANSLNIVHGGMTATLLDSAMGNLAHKVLAENLAAVTTEIKINYVAPGIGDSFRCIASIIHKGTKIIVVEGKVFRDDNVLMAHSTGSFFIIRRG
ncbi:PaaI family thioesterase [Bacillus sp. HMF5848]|uniref:PaaI family thioesterase n=1 Tax=Bacillus sp. HMF5848 TaxID=2495421 RepID=UPI000F778BBC|nr:PaaI family thioesterase [Bacillus sp. HMF5848]RSK26910.1 PaaI family thioesterase [Bacillus sp. HMF5848]